jgi:hypothetical protein
VLATTAAAGEDLPEDEGYAPAPVYTDLFGAVMK